VSSKQRNPANNAPFRRSGALFWQFRVKSRQWRGNHDVGGEYAVYMMAASAGMAAKPAFSEACTGAKP
jgi:hypothetical protein